MSGKSHPIFDFFNYDRDSNSSICLIDDCKHPRMVGRHANNLTKHLQRRHPAFTNQFNEKMNEHPGRKPLKQKQKTTVITLKISREEFLMGCLETVVVNGRPFSLFNDSGVIRIFRPIFVEFDRAKASVTTDALYLQQRGYQMQQMIKNEIKAELKGKLIPLQLDLTTHFKRRLIGVNVQYFVQNKLVLRVLGMKRLLVPATAINIALEVEKILKEYDVEVDDIYAITTDNGANVLCCTTVLQIMQERRLEQFISSQNIDTVNMEALNELIEIEANRISRGQALHFLHQVNCSAHTMQLAIGDALESSEANVIVNTCRTLVVILRRQNIINLLVSKNMNVPILDCATRWSSVHAMVSKSIQRTRAVKGSN